MRRVKAAVSGTRLFLGATQWIANAALFVGFRSVRRDRSSHVALVPPSDGNIGDYAMVQSLVAGSKRPFVGLCEVAGTLRTGAGEPRAAFVDLPDLVHGNGRTHLRSLVRAGRILAGAAEFSVVGADMMDGGYGRLGAYRRWGLARFAARVGIPSRVTGFSLNLAPDAVVMRSARMADRAGVASLLRDPDSFRRARDAGLGRATEVKDLVFSRTIEMQESARVKRVCSGLRDERFVVVNCSGLIQKRFDQVPEYRIVLQTLKTLGLSVVLVPHVSHVGSDDVQPLRELVDPFDGTQQLIEELWDPSEILALVARASFVVTGRMHLAVLAISQGTPAIVLSTQGKVEGLLKDAQMPEACIEPGTGMGTIIATLCSRLAADDGTAHKLMLSAADRFEGEARLNFLPVEAARLRA